jgi:hypothetical protein
MKQDRLLFKPSFGIPWFAPDVVSDLTRKILWAREGKEGKIRWQLKEIGSARQI